VNDQGTAVRYPSTRNDSQLAYEKALAWINSRTPVSRPFFIQYSPTNPHNPYTPTAAHAHDYDTVPPRNVPSVNEADMSDKPAKMQKGTISRSELEAVEEGMREELEDTDDFIAGLLDAAEAVTGNSNLLVIFHSDNGFQAGEHRLMNKSWPYQESVEIPLIMRGTGLPAQEPTQLVSSVDIFGTILNFAGVAPPRAPDGRSLHEIVLGNQPASWRKRVVIENPDDRYWQMYREFQPALVPRAGKDFAFIRHLNDPTPEFYDLTVDEYQLDSNPAMVTADMRSKLDRLTSLTGANLRAVEEEVSTQGGDTTAPTVMSTVPTANATGVSPTTNVTATFSEDMKASSIVTPATTFKLVKLNANGTTTKVTATVTYDTATKQAILDPSSDLSPGQTYKATVTTGAQDSAGNALDQKPNIAGNQSKSWKFTVQ
jgi:arylsulfatase A-like enzyme